jgi:hypothetical protein
MMHPMGLNLAAELEYRRGRMAPVNQSGPGAIRRSRRRTRRRRQDTAAVQGAPAGSPQRAA